MNICCTIPSSILRRFPASSTFALESLKIDNKTNERILKILYFARIELCLIETTPGPCFANIPTATACGNMR
jgi:hypothetical protein